SITPAGAMLLPLEWRLAEVKHPAMADDPSFDPFAEARPRGLLDAGVLAQIEPDGSGKSIAFKVAARQDGDIRDYNRSDGLREGELTTVLQYVRQKMAALCEEWLSGEIRVQPARVGRELPCGYCPYRSVCRFEYVLGRVRHCDAMNREDAMQCMRDALEAESSDP